MNKLTEKQKILVYVGIGVVVFLLFSILSYLDYVAIDDLDRLQKKEAKKLAKLEKQKKEIQSKFLPQMFNGLAEYDAFKSKLLTEKEIESMFETFEKWRDKVSASTQMDVGAWGLKVDETNLEKKVDPKSGGTAKKKRGRGRNKKAAPSVFDATNFSVSVVCTFQQLGMLLDLIEHEEKFYAVTEFKIPKLSFSSGRKRRRRGARVSVKEGPIEPRAKMTFKVVSYSLKSTGAVQVLMDVNDYLDPKNGKGKKYAKAINKLKKAQKKAEEASEAQAQAQAAPSEFVNWQPGIPNPFRPKLTPIVVEQGPIGPRPPGATTSTGKDVGPPPDRTLEQMELDYDKLKQIREAILSDLAAEKKWSLLRNELNQEVLENQKYPEALSRLDTRLRRYNTKDSQGEAANKRRELQAKVLELSRECRNWQDLIRKRDRRGEADSLIRNVMAKISRMNEIYTRGKAARSPQILAEGKNIHREFASSLKGELQYFGRSKDSHDNEMYRRLLGVDESAQLALTKITNQIKILDYALKLQKNFQGVIQYEDPKKKKTISVAYINNEPKVVGAPLTEGFQVRNITEKGIELQFGKEETVMVYIPRTTRMEELARRATERIVQRRELKKK